MNEEEDTQYLWMQEPERGFYVILCRQAPISSPAMQTMGTVVLAMSLLTSLGLLPVGLVSGLKSISKFLMIAALAAIGLNTNFKSLCRSGAKPMLHGFIISALVVLVAIGVEYVIGIAPYGTL